MVIAAGLAAIVVTVALMVVAILVARHTRYRDAEAVTHELGDELREVLLARLSPEELVAWSRRLRADRTLPTEGPFDGGI